MKKTLIVTDLTRMGWDRVCLAGHTEDGTCVRPQLSFGHFVESWLYEGGTAVVHPFRQIELNLERPVPDPPHTEDWIVTAGPAVPRGELVVTDRPKFLRGLADEGVRAIFGARVHDDQGHWVAAGEGNRSLGTVRVKVWDAYHGPKPNGRGWDHRLSFTDASGEQFRLAVTDLTFQYYIDHERAAGRISGTGPAYAVGALLNRSRDVYLRIGLARHWVEHPDRCYLQVNGIYSFPDYLGGRCFADFSPVRLETSQLEPERELELAALPF